MSVVVSKQPSNVYSSLPNYMVMTSDNSDKNKFEYVVDITYKPIEVDNITATFLNNDNSITCTADIVPSTYSLQKDSLVSCILESGYYAIFKVYSVNGSDLIMSTYSSSDNTQDYGKTGYNKLYDDLINATGNDYNSIITSFVRKKISPDLDGNGIVDFNSVLRDSVFPKFKEYASDDILTNMYVEFNYIIFEDYLIELEVTSTGIPSQSNYNRFNYSGDVLSDLFPPNTEMILEPTTNGSIAYYNGNQTLVNRGSSFGNGYFETNKPQKYGVDATSKVAYKADQSTDNFLSVEGVQYKRVDFGNLYFNDLAGLNDVEYSAYVENQRDIEINNLIPSIQKVSIEDKGFIAWHPSNTLNLTLSYSVNGFPLDDVILSNNVSNYFYVPSHPTSINEMGLTSSGSPFVIDCDASVYTLTMSSSDGFDTFESRTFTFNINKGNRIRLVHADNLGHYQGFDFFGNCRKTNNVDRFTFEQDYNRYQNNNIVPYNGLDRGTNTINTSNTEVWSLNTTYLTDEESKYFKTLLVSSDVYIQDYDGNMNACVINNNSLEEKRSANGLIRYSISVTIANKVVFYGN